MDSRTAPSVAGQNARQRPIKAKGESQTKRQATPSQARANHEKQKQQRASGKQAAAAAEKQLTAKVKSLHEQADKSLDAYAQRAREIKEQISASLERQDKFHQANGQMNNVDSLKESILELGGARELAPDLATERGCSAGDEQQVTLESGADETAAAAAAPQTNCSVIVEGTKSTPDAVDPESNAMAAVESVAEGRQVEGRTSGPQVLKPSCTEMTTSGANQTVEKQQPELPAAAAAEAQSAETTNNWFEPLTARLDPRSKFLTLRSSLERHFVDSPQLLEPICHKFINLANQIETLSLCNEQSQLECRKLASIKDKLGDLCRELQKSNNQIRIESLDLIKMEQNKAKEQAGKIQSTMSGVMKLFDENQQRNLSLKQENMELQSKLKSLLEHCDNWEKCVETTLKQREIENRLAKTEAARLSLIRTEEKESFFKEKSELLKALTMMREQQSKIEVKEAKLRSDLTNYASKYDECQEIIHKGLSKFQVESKRMLKQIEQGRRDYIQLLNKYEASNKKIKQLLEEKQSWAQSMGAANNKLEALERLCRALKGENDRLSRLVASSGAPTEAAPAAAAAAITSSSSEKSDNTSS